VTRSMGSIKMEIDCLKILSSTQPQLIGDLLGVFQCNIDHRNSPYYILNCCILLNVMHISDTPLPMWTIYEKIIFSTSPTLNRFPWISSYQLNWLSLTLCWLLLLIFIMGRLEPFLSLIKLLLLLFLPCTCGVLACFYYDHNNI
jgi:hypothetical protein